MRIKKISLPSGELEYSIEGEGRPILFFHGGHSNCREKLIRKGLSLNEFYLIVPSRPGYGATPLSNNGSPNNTARLFAELLEYLKIEKAVIYGISAGGLSAIEFASTFPEKTDKLILVSAVTKKWLNPDEKIYKAAKKIFNPKIQKFTWGLVKIFFKLLPLLIAKNFHKEFSAVKIKKLREEDVIELAENFSTFYSGDGFINDIDQNIPEEEIEKIQCPTLIVHSENDASVSFDHAKYALEKISGSKPLALKNEWGHMIWLGEDAPQTLAKIKNFILN